ncbi:MAG: hypothetical protein CMQ75_01660 [Gammaproteobacteria bacterium]|nr:hypothetical protein [Gammaproteobacteria bacterium]RPG99500.1 MAG: hypothetical protein CBC78_001860 [Candidatus Pelagibacter sp. TMED118]|tara:strand:+ start:440 stop:1144 length:705 start_codon:yes stop_codon:yes gene_type:complete
MLDVVQISYYESYADDNFETLQFYAPLAKQVKGVKGIFEAHKAAAELAETSHFYVIDADAIMEEEFSFKFRPLSTRDQWPGVPETDCVYVWRSRNPVNDLLYGYGGAKLFPRKKLLEADDWQVDMTTTIGCPFVPKFQVSNVTAFNTDPFNAWRSAFRECTKLASAIIPNGDNTDNEYRLKVWQTKGADRENGKYAVQGAQQGADFGRAYRNNIKTLSLINDFEWLEQTFKEAG